MHPRVFEHLVIQPCPGNQTTTRTTDPHQTFCRFPLKSWTHTHSTLHLDCVNRLQMISQKWNQGFGGVFSFVTSSPVSRDTSNLRCFSGGFSPGHFRLFRQTPMKICEVELAGGIWIKIRLWIQIFSDCPLPSCPKSVVFVVGTWQV